MINCGAEKEKLVAALEPLGLIAWQYHHSVASTNDLALDWARAGAPDWSLVVADTQTAGRGRGDRVWVSKPGSLAVSLVLRPSPQEALHLARFTALAGLGLVHALGALGLQAEIKWPNDVLLAGKKVAGVLVESEWEGDSLDTLVVGLGVNIAKASQPEANKLRYPATTVEDILGKPVDRWAVLALVLRAMQELRTQLPGMAYIQAWNQHLAFRGELVRLRTSGGELLEARLVGVNENGGLTVQALDGDKKDFLAGEIVLG